MLLIQSLPLPRPSEALRQALCCPLVAPAVKELFQKGRRQTYTGILKIGTVEEKNLNFLDSVVTLNYGHLLPFTDIATIGNYHLSRSLTGVPAGLKLWWFWSGHLYGKNLGQ